MDELVSKKKFASIHKVCLSTINNWIRKGLPHDNSFFSRMIVIPKNQAEEWLKHNKGITYEEAAKIAKVHSETLRYWNRTIPSFKEVLLKSVAGQRNISEERFCEWVLKHRPIDHGITDLITIKEASFLSNISKSRILNLCQNNPSFACVKLGVHGRQVENGKHFVSKSGFLDWVSKQQ